MDKLKEAVEILKRWNAISYRLDGCHDPDCNICKESNKLIADTANFVKENKGV